MTVQELLRSSEFQTYAMARYLAMVLGAVFLARDATRDDLDSAFETWLEEYYQERPELRLVDGDAA